MLQYAFSDKIICGISLPLTTKYIGLTKMFAVGSSSFRYSLSLFRGTVSGEKRFAMTISMLFFKLSFLQLLCEHRLCNYPCKNCLKSIMSDILGKLLKQCYF